MADVEDKMKIDDNDDDVKTEDAKDDDEKKPEDLSGDGGVLKEIIKEGDGWEKPQKGADVTVHYVGTLLSGEEFDSSRGRNEPFNFQIEAGQVIKGWDVAVKSMKKGEKAKFTLKPEFAYGASGSPPKIPGNATLVFEIELLSFRNEKDITKDKDGGVVKKTIQEGKEKYGPSPNYEARCSVRIVGKLSNDREFLNYAEKSVVIGDEDVPRGVELAIENLKVGEIGHFIVKPQYAYGAAGDAALGVPPNETVSFEIELLSLTKEKEYYEYDKFEEKFEAATQRKDQGNALFKQGKLERAAKKYKKGLEFFEYMYKATDDEKKKANDVKLPLHLNLAQVHIKERDIAKAIEQANKALEIDRQNVKAYYRRAQAYVLKVEWDLATADFTKALELDPNNEDIKREFQRLKLKIKSQDQKDKNLFKKMLSGLSDPAESSAPSSSQPAAAPKQDNDDKMNVDAVPTN